MLDLDAIEARANRATPGPWDAIGPYEVHVLAACDCEPEGACGDCEDGGFAVCSFNEHMRERAFANFEFIAHARTDIPALIARVRELEAEVERMRPWYPTPRLLAKSMLGNRKEQPCAHAWIATEEGIRCAACGEAA